MLRDFRFYIRMVLMTFNDIKFLEYDIMKFLWHCISGFKYEYNYLTAFSLILE